ncbi:MAG: hypothetical protein ACW98U_12100 [Candidatus Thorarchaeota archaeon]
MEKFQGSEAVREQLRYAMLSKSLLKRFIFGRSILMIIPLTVLPGLILLVLPAEVALVSKIRDETELIQWVRNNMITQQSNLEDIESETEMARLRSHDRPGALQGYTR